MTFKAATETLTRCHSLEDVARAAGVSYSLIRQARLDSDHVNHRAPPDGWEKAVARLARERAAELLELAEELES